MKSEKETRLILIKSVHTLIWTLFVVIIAFVLWSGVTAHISLYSWLAVLAVLGEGLVLVIFKGSCPLIKVAGSYSDSDKSNFDIYLPEWLARYNKEIFGTIFVVGLILMLFNHFRP